MRLRIRAVAVDLESRDVGGSADGGDLGARDVGCCGAWICSPGWAGFS